MARMYLLQHRDHFNAPIYIGYDNISAADCSFMKSVTSNDSLLAGIAAATHFETAKYHSIGGFHVHSHQGHPWNELVDSLCNFYKTRSPLVANVPFAPLSRSACFDYQMLASLNDSFVCNSLTVDESHCYNSLRPPPPMSSPIVLITPKLCNGTHRVKHRHCFVKCIQFNVQTLSQFYSRKICLLTF